MSQNLELRSQSTKLTEKIVNLTSTNSQLTQEVERLVRNELQLEEEKRNMSQTIRRLVSSDAQREEKQQQLSEVSLLLRAELSHLKERNRQLLEVHNRYEGEAQKRADCEEVSQSNAELREHNQRLQSSVRAKVQKAVESEEQMAAQINSTREALHTFNLYCPVVNRKTRGLCI